LEVVSEFTQTAATEKDGKQIYLFLTVDADIVSVYVD
jgi:hypothetical protein